MIEGVLAGVPWVDAVTTSEFDKRGNPNDKECYYYMISYSPYGSMKDRGYPAMLVGAGCATFSFNRGSRQKG